MACIPVTLLLHAHPCSDTHMAPPGVISRAGSTTFWQRESSSPGLVSSEFRGAMGSGWVLWLSERDLPWCGLVRIPWVCIKHLHCLIKDVLLACSEAWEACSEAWEVRRVNRIQGCWIPELQLCPRPVVCAFSSAFFGVGFIFRYRLSPGGGYLAPSPGYHSRLEESRLA